MAARYKASIGELQDEAMIEPAFGSRAECCARDLSMSVLVALVTPNDAYPFFTPSICKSIHHIPGIPNIHHSDAFLPNTPNGRNWKNEKYAMLKKSRSGTRQT